MVAQKGLAALLSQVKPAMKALTDADIGSPVSLTGLDKRAADLRAYLGSTDYSKQLQQAQDAAKLQAALGVMSRGFASMGATPKRGESPFATVGRELLAPVGADLIPVATKLMERKAAIDAAKQTEDRQVKLAAYTQAQAEKKAKEGYAMSLVEAWTKASGKTDFSITNLQDVMATATINGKSVKIPDANITVFMDKKGTGAQRIITAGESKSSDGTVVPAGTVIKGFNKKPTAPATKTDTVFGQVFDKNTNTFKTVGNVLKTTKIIPSKTGPDGIEIKYRQQDPISRKWELIPDFTENLESHGPYKKSDPLYVVDAAAVAKQLGLKKDAVRVGDIIATHVRPANTKTGATEDLVQRRFKSAVVTDKLPQSFLDTDAVQTDVLTSTQKEEAGQTIPTWKKLQELTIDASTVGLLPDAKINEKVILQYSGDETRFMFRGEEISKDIGKQIRASALSNLEKRTEGLEAKIYDKGEPLIINAKLQTALSNLGIKDVTIGDQIAVLINRDDIDDHKYKYRGISLARTLVEQAQASPLSPTQKFAAGQTLRPFVDLDVLNITDDKAVKWLTKMGYPVDVGDSIKIQVSKGDPVAGVLDQFKYTLKGDDLPPRVVNDPIFKSMVKDRGITDAEKRLAGQTFSVQETFTNPTQLTVTIDDISIPPGESRTLNQIQQRNANPDDLAKLRPFSAATDATPQSFMFSGYGRYGDYDYAPGDTLNLTGSQYTTLSPELRKILTTEAQQKAEIVKTNNFKALWKDVMRQQKAVIPPANLVDPTESQIKALLGEFPGRHTKKALRESILNMLRTKEKPSPNAVSAGEVTQKHLSFADSIRDLLKDAKGRWDPLVEAGALTQPWDQLTYTDKRAFALLGRNRLNVHTVAENWEKAKKKIAEQKARFKMPDPEDAAALAAAVKLKMLADYLLKSGDLKKTGVLRGIFSETGATKLADFFDGAFTTSDSETVNQIITNMRAQLKTLSSTEGSDGKPSNFRIMLQEELVPAFRQSEALNKRNLKTISSKLGSSIRSRFTPEITTTHVIPQSYVKAARVAGINVSVDPKRYASFFDPNDELNKDFNLVTEKELMASINKFEYGLDKFNKLKIGQALPPTRSGRVFIKISDTEMREADESGRLPDPKADRYLAKDFLPN